MVAAGVFAPGHLGELTRLVPFEMVDDVLAVTRRTEVRVRLLPARVVMYLLLAGCLFAELGYLQVWRKLTSGLTGLAIVAPSGSALRQARQRLGPQPVRALFDLLRGPAVTSATQVRWRGLLLTVIDGTFLTVADSAANTGRYSKQRGNNGGSGYPQRPAVLRHPLSVGCRVRSGPRPGNSTRPAGSPAVCSPGCCCWLTATTPPLTWSPPSPRPARTY